MHVARQQFGRGRRLGCRFSQVACCRLPIRMRTRTAVPSVLQPSPTMATQPPTTDLTVKTPAPVTAPTSTPGVAPIVVGETSGPVTPRSSAPPAVAPTPPLVRSSLVCVPCCWCFSVVWASWIGVWHGWVSSPESLDRNCSCSTVICMEQDVECLACGLLFGG